MTTSGLPPGRSYFYLRRAPRATKPQGSMNGCGGLAFPYFLDISGPCEKVCLSIKECHHLRGRRHFSQPFPKCPKHVLKECYRHSPWLRHSKADL